MSIRTIVNSIVPYQKNKRKMSCASQTKFLIDLYSNQLLSSVHTRASLKSLKYAFTESSLGYIYLLRYINPIAVHNNAPLSTETDEWIWISLLQ